MGDESFRRALARQRLKKEPQRSPRSATGLQETLSQCTEGNVTKINIFQSIENIPNTATSSCWASQRACTPTLSIKLPDIAAF